MGVINNALRQAFMPKQDYQNPRDEQKASIKLQRPLFLTLLCFLSLSILISTVISVKIVFPFDSSYRPYCYARNDQNDTASLLPGAFYLTDQETVDYFYVVLFIPTFVLFLATVTYLVAGIMVAYFAPQRHGCLKVVENNYCASRRGGVRCLAILNMVFAIMFGLLAIFLGSSLLTLGNSCSVPLFWCYEVASWGLVILFGGTSISLRRKAAVILDEGSFSGRNLGLEMLEAKPLDITPDVERRVDEGFKSWMGSSLLSSDDDDEPDQYQEVLHNITNQSRQRLLT